MPNCSPLDLDYRPATYWDPGLMVIANITGDIRQANVIDYHHEGRMEELPDWFFAESLAPDKLDKLASERRSWLGGESLPDYLEGEVEIARITLHPAYRYVVAIRARPSGDRIAYRIVSEWEPVAESELGFSDEPLSQRELLARIKAVQVDDESLISHWWSQVGEADGVIPAVASLKLSSVFYPGLVGRYHETAFTFAAGLTKINLSGDLTMPLFGGPQTPAQPLSRLQLAAICGDADSARQSLAEGEDPEKPVDPMIPVVVARVPAFGFNRPLVDRIYQHLGYDLRLIEPGMTARELASAAGHTEVAAMLTTASGGTQ